MDKLYIGMVTFGNLPYTRMAIQSLMETASPPAEFVVVVGKPGDEETVSYLDGIPEENEEGDSIIILKRHPTNLGFPWGINDIMQYVFKMAGADKLLIVGNDCIAYPDAVDELLYVAAAYPDFDYFSGTETKSVWFKDKYPHRSSMINPDGVLNVGGVGWEPYYFKEHLAHWEDVKRNSSLWGKVKEITYINGFHNFALIRKSYFDKVGYVDPAFFPAYYEDVDYVRRGRLAGCKFAEVPMAQYFNFESTTIKTETGDMHRRYFPLNRRYYEEKWEGGPGEELNVRPFAGRTTRHGRVLASAEHFDLKERNDIFERGMVDYMKWTPAGFKDLHKGQRCVIACNGPSLNDVDMDLLRGEIVFGLNRGYMKNKLPMTYQVAVNLNVLHQWGEKIVDYHFLGDGAWDVIPTFIPHGLDEFWHPHVYGLLFGPPEERFFSTDIDRPIYQGHTVSFVALQIAYYMGFSDVIMVGMDHHYPRAEGHPTNTPIESKGPDTDHFHSEYFPVGSTWETPNLGRSEEAYRMALEAYTAAGRQVVNASTFSRCDVFPRVSLEEALR